MFATPEKVTVIRRKRKIVVVGAGITGASIAWHLASHEFDVTLIEQKMPASVNVRETAMAAQTAVRSRLKGAESSALIHYSTGERPVPQDGYPILGFIDESKSLYVASMHPAVTCAATIGRLVCEELSDGKYDAIPQNYRPSRFTTKP